MGSRIGHAFAGASANGKGRKEGGGIRDTIKEPLHLFGQMQSPIPIIYANYAICYYRQILYQTRSGLKDIENIHLFQVHEYISKIHPL